VIPARPPKGGRRFFARPVRTGISDGVRSYALLRAGGQTHFESSPQNAVFAAVVPANQSKPTKMGVTGRFCDIALNVNPKPLSNLQIYQFANFSLHHVVKCIIIIVLRILWGYLTENSGGINSFFAEINFIFGLIFSRWMVYDKIRQSFSPTKGG